MLFSLVTNFQLLFSRFAVSCDSDKTGFFGLPKWYEYLPKVSRDLPAEFGGNASHTAQTCIVQLNSLKDVWLIGAAVIEILLRLAVVVAIIFVIIGGVKYITSEGEPDKLSQALKTIISAVVGLAISIVAATVISFLAGKFGA